MSVSNTRDWRGWQGELQGQTVSPRRPPLFMRGRLHGYTVVFGDKSSWLFPDMHDTKDHLRSEDLQRRRFLLFFFFFFFPFPPRKNESHNKNDGQYMKKLYTIKITASKFISFGSPWTPAHFSSRQYRTPVLTAFLFSCTRNVIIF